MTLNIRLVDHPLLTGFLPGTNNRDQDNCVTPDWYCKIKCPVHCNSKLLDGGGGGGGRGVMIIIMC